MKPKILFLSHQSELPLRQRRLLEQEFNVSIHGCDWSYGLIRCLWKLKGYDCIICQTAYHGFMASLIVPDTPIIVENHGDLHYRKKWIAKFVVNRALALRAVSNCTARQFDELFLDHANKREDGKGGWKYTKIFPAWTDAQLFWEAGRIYPKSSLKHALYCGGERRHKGWEVVKKIMTRVPVKVVQGVSQIELARYMAKASVVVVPSFSEGLGLVALESMMTGTPVVASNVGGLKEIVKHNLTGLRCKVGDVDGFVHAIKRVMENEYLASELSARGQEFVWKYWTNERYLSGYRKLVKEVLR